MEKKKRIKKRFMTGKLKKEGNNWFVIFYDESRYPICPSSLITNRLSDGTNVQFELEDFWETGMEEVIKVAVILPRVPELTYKNFHQFSLYEHKETITSSDINTTSQTEISDEEWVGCDGCTETDEYFWKKGFQAGYNKAKPIEISDEEIQEGVDEHFSADDMVTERFAFKLGANWYKALLKSKKQ